MPLRMSMTAIAAKRRFVTFDNALVPAFPRIFIMKLESKSTKPANKILTNTDISVAASPYSPIIINEVVKTAGPTISGVPRGTAPSS